MSICNSMHGAPWSSPAHRDLSKGHQIPLGRDRSQLKMLGIERLRLMGEEEEDFKAG